MLQSDLYQTVVNGVTITVTEAGYDVLAITNAGFYDLNTTMTYIPWGMQIVDGQVLQEPSKDSLAYSNNWFGITTDGQYVISDTEYGRRKPDHHVSGNLHL